MTLHPQMPLPLGADRKPTLASFLRGANGLVVDLVGELSTVQGTHQLYLWGGLNSGKSHLLLASHGDWLATGARSFYASLASSSVEPAMIDALEGCDHVALDDIDAVAGNAEWERALFNLINFARDAERKLLFAANAAPAQLPWLLPDLASRLTWGPVLQLQRLTDDECRDALVAAARLRGMQLNEEIAAYLLRHHSRDVKTLLDAVAILDRESIAAGRHKITIPFLKRCLELAA